MSSSSSLTRHASHKHVRSKSTTNDETSTTATRSDLKDLDPEIKIRLQTIGMRSRKAVADGYLTRAQGESSNYALGRTKSAPAMVNESLPPLCPQHEGMAVEPYRPLMPFAETGNFARDSNRIVVGKRRAEEAGPGDEEEVPTDVDSGDEAPVRASPVRTTRTIARPRRGLSKYTSMPEAAIRRHALTTSQPSSAVAVAMEEDVEPWQRVQLDGYFDAQSGF